MASPCPRCGTTKTESVRHGFIHNTLWNMGYHLRRCSYCNRRRIFKRGDPARHHPDDMTAEELRERFNRKVAEALEKTSETPESTGETMTPDSAQESLKPGEARESSVGVAEAPDEGDDYRLCPKCGSTVYRRSRRRWYEHLMKRPRMARCMRCGNRFPYPR